VKNAKEISKLRKTDKLIAIGVIIVISLLMLLLHQIQTIQSLMTLEQKIEAERFEKELDNLRYSDAVYKYYEDLNNMPIDLELLLDEVDRMREVYRKIEFVKDKYNREVR